MPRPAPGVERTVALITFLSRHPGRPFSLSELARQLDLNKATAHAMLAALTDSGWLLRDTAHKTYQLGAALVSIGDAAAGADRHALELARPHMLRLSDELGVQVVASTVLGDDIVVLAIEGHAAAPNDFVSRPGSRIPLSPPLGTVFVAWSDAGDVEQWLRRLSPRLDDHRLGIYRDAIKVIRRRGYTVALNDDWRHDLSRALGVFADSYGDTEVRTAVERVIQAMSDEKKYLLVDLDGIEAQQFSLISAPIFDNTGRVRLAISLTGFAARLRPQQIAAYGRRLAEATMAITRRIDGHPPDEAMTA
ncbi:IclR family transcriptional regulator [Parafrankia colletiae]|uniref:IclR family transcriptional regulator n=1 Tax=Parafrankia colletiae TaxID=573497 RepID=A0A1S1PWQ7_9ACTN|nr:helix-turn-helix domain-containing protein [Parafrankia colletiae]MCK9904713.1 helix-turn-helix domain-containing protein [Frankia sp. Cpl3]OHV27113.1 IclR family transcriptional regulator [Parafrankia colletiae]